MNKKESDAFFNGIFATVTTILLLGLIIFLIDLWLESAKNGGYQKCMYEFNDNGICKLLGEY